ncbi:transcription factor with AP2 domain(s), putative [Plasmodium vinckei brucechwatti]|uniref:Transcription factor with AP2 domain(S), putative n=1 Tax=Plasmodium vinckei brucechwatti TaxID=119398 RepID=A0A6V7SUW3_PLAVN|nr:transcription factor with AP2 domain(s), putative [Plasmodium vinckei brucechwatti]
MIFRYFHCMVNTHNFQGNKILSKQFLQNDLNTYRKSIVLIKVSNYVVKEVDIKQKEQISSNQFKNKGCHNYTISNNHFIYPKYNSLFVNGFVNNINNNVGLYYGNIFYKDKMFFSGRSGGLKRKKRRKDERVINTCSAKRLEFFYPKKKRRQRVGLIQNSRKNIVYDNVLKRFLVYYYKQGIQVFRSFSCKKKRNFESARNKAIILSKQYNQKYTKQRNLEKDNSKDHLIINNSTNLVVRHDYDIRKKVKIVPDKNKSGYRGVFYDASNHAYICTYNEAGIRKYQIFKIQNNDYLEAYNLAVMCRRYKLFKNYQFVSQRNRVRSGRIHLK